ncbi:hypothetical protein DICPUDRAFT_39668 [Dictyostelium purpureum]|uniref:Uncharacterized protein n=1 Tax=Dictyostelium purpureum TaxID=5786 RepID=F0ZWQ1_DICPU|nr:uncharacterized protein DICPUDRAFT_39668 [Dictyostelium purpureum]EGC31616.1 hypothetical protein DICPUDRAFT_39668 [Dictyostelium purpureum]|eukprot:XP_003291844.1 hypothetical protein DICPUDRAFT_39668 [Dictyostelium purpureum]
MKILIALVLIFYMSVNVRSQFTPTGFPNNVLSSSSPWNTPIGSTPTVEPLSSQMMLKVKNAMISESYNPNLYLHYFQWTAPLHNINTANPVNRITVIQSQGEGFHETVDPLNTKKITNLPVDFSFKPDPMNDGHMIVFDTNLKVFHEFSRFKWINSTHANATRYDTFAYNVDGTYPAFVSGTRWWMKGVRGSGAPFIAGLIRWDEIQRGELNHALAVGSLVNRMKSSTSSSWSYELCSPVSSRTDGWVVGADTIMEGQRIQLDPNYDISAFPPKSKLVLQALKTYGGYVVDNSGTFGIYFQNMNTDGVATNSPWYTQLGADLTSLYDVPIDAFRVLSCSNVSTK